MKQHRKNYFNMVEVTLALGVAVIGVVCIMALIPVGMNASRDATADNYLPDVAQEIMSILKIQSLMSGELQIPAGIPSEADKNNLFTDVLTKNVEFEVEFDRGAPPSTYLNFMGTNLKSSGGLVLQKEASGLFLILQQLEIDGAYVTEFSGVARVWYESLSDFKFFNKSGIPLPPDLAKVLMMEVSWPANIPHDRRKELGNIRTYRMDLFNPEAKL